MTARANLIAFIRAGSWRRVLVVAAAVAVVMPLIGGAQVAAGYAYHGTDLLNFSAPSSGCGGTGCAGDYYGAYPWGAYDLDAHITGVSAGIGGIDLSGLPAWAFFIISSVLWDAALLGLHLAFVVFGFAFSLNLLTRTGGGAFTSGFGLLNGLHGAVSGIFSSGPFQQVLFISFASVGAYALCGLAKQEYARTFKRVLGSVLIYALALGIIADPGQTIGVAGDTTNALANGMLSVAAKLASGSGGDLRTGDGPILTAQDGLFKLGVFDPFEILEFGGLSHCAARSAGGLSVADDPSSSGGCAPYADASAVTSVPISSEKYARWFLETSKPSCVLQLDQAAVLAVNDRLAKGDQLLLPQGSDPSCVLGPYDEHPNGAPAPNVNVALFTAQLAALGTSMTPAQFAGADPIGEIRTHIFDAMEDNVGDVFSKGLRGALRISWPDASAGDAQLQQSQSERLAVTGLVLAGAIPQMILIGGLSVGVLFAQLLVLIGLVLLPAVLLLGLFPGRGHALFFEWGKRMATALAVKFFYSLILIAVLAMEFALADATNATGFGWTFSYVVQIAFFWVLVLKRRQITGQFNEVVTSRRTEQGRLTDELADVYLGTRIGRMGAQTLARNGRRTGRAANSARQLIGEGARRTRGGLDRVGQAGDNVRARRSPPPIDGQDPSGSGGPDGPSGSGGGGDGRDPRGAGPGDGDGGNDPIGLAPRPLSAAPDSPPATSDAGQSAHRDPPAGAPPPTRDMTSAREPAGERPVPQVATRDENDAPGSRSIGEPRGRTIRHDATAPVRAARDDAPQPSPTSPPAVADVRAETAARPSMAGRIPAASGSRREERSSPPATAPRKAGGARSVAPVGAPETPRAERSFLPEVPPAVTAAKRPAREPSPREDRQQPPARSSRKRASRAEETERQSSRSTVSRPSDDGEETPTPTAPRRPPADRSRIERPETADLAALLRELDRGER